MRIRILLCALVSLFALLKFTAAHEKESVAPCEKAMSTVEMQACLSQQYKKTDDELNQTYAQLMAVLSKARKEKLKSAQRAWIVFRDSSAEFEASEEEGGTMYPLVYLSVKASMTERRVNELRLIRRRMDMR